MPEPHPTGPLAGYRVLDLADATGQLCGRLLGELGADVIKIEPRGGDVARTLGPFYRAQAGPEQSLWWWTMNAGKRSVTCEQRLEAGREIIRRLADSCDVFIETFAPGTAADLGLDYGSLAQRNPAIVVVSITPFGPQGPRALWLATDIVASAMGGHMHLNGDADNGPVRTLAPQAYTQVSVQAAIGALTALYGREALGGTGQHVDVSMQEAMAQTMDGASQTWDLRGLNISGSGTRRNVGGYVGLREIYETADGWVACSATDGLTGAASGLLIDWLAEAGEAGELGTPAWRGRLADPAELTTEDRSLIEETVAAFCLSRQKMKLVEAAQSRGLSWSPILTTAEIVDLEQLRSRDYWVRVQHEDIGESFIYPGAPFRLSETPWKQRGRAPHVGEHNAEVYGELGISEQEQRRLRTRMVI